MNKEKWYGILDGLVFCNMYLRPFHSYHCVSPTHFHGKQITLNNSILHRFSVWSMFFSVQLATKQFNISFVFKIAII